MTTQKNYSRYENFGAYAEFNNAPVATHRVLRAITRAAEREADIPLFGWNCFGSGVLPALEAAGISKIEIDSSSVQVEDLAALHAAGWTFEGKSDREEVVFNRTEKCGGAVFVKK